MLNRLAHRNGKPLPRLIATLAFSVVLMAPLACSGSAGEAPSAPRAAAQGDLVAKLPAGATAIGFVDVARLRDSGLYDYAEQQGADIAEAEGLQEFIDKTGFDPRTDLHQVVWVTTGGFGEGMESAGALLGVATIDREKVIAALADQESFEHGGFTVYQLRDAGDEAEGDVEAGGMEMSFDTSGALALLSTDTFVVGSEAAVRSVIDVEGGAASARANSALMDLLEDVDTDAEIWAVAAQEGMLRGLRPNDDTPVPQIPVDRINAMIVSMRVTDGLSFTLRGRTGAEEDAKLLGDSLNGMLAFGKMMLQSNQPEIFEIIDRGVTAGSSGYDVTIRAQLTLEEVEKLQSFARETMSDAGDSGEEIG